MGAGSGGTAGGLRVAQSVDGDVTEFTWDWAAGLPELLAATESTNPEPTLYLVGHETLARWDGAAWAYHLPDALGSVRQVADSAGVVTAAREWTPYGVEVGAAQAGLGYTGEWWDADVELLYLRARWYAPGTERFTSRDPIAGILRWGGSYNAYGYADQNPINRVDPSGLLSNATLAASFGVDSFEEVMAVFERYQDWALLKLLQDADVGDRIYAGKFNWTFYAGTIEWVCI